MSQAPPLIAALPPPNVRRGEYLLLLHHPDTVHESRRVSITPATPTRLEVVLEPGVPRTLHLDLPPPEDGRSRELWLEFRTPQGERRLELLWNLRSGVTRGTIELRLPDEPLEARARLTHDASFVDVPIAGPGDPDRSKTAVAE